MDTLTTAALTVTATVGTMAIMYLYLFRVVLPRVIQNSFQTVMDGGEHLINKAQGMIRKERTQTLREIAHLTDEVMLATDERLCRLERIVGKLPFQTKGSGGGILGKLGKSLGFDVGGMVQGALDNPDLIAGILQGGSSPPPPGTPTPNLYALK